MSRRATSGGSLLLGWPVRHTAPSQEEQKMKDAVFSLSLIFTFLLGVWNIVNNYRMARRTAFINTVTAERIKWIEKLRDNISSFCGLTHTWRQSELEGKPDELDVVKRLDKLRYLIRLQLNPAGASHKEIESPIALIPDLTHESQTKQLKQKMNELIVVSQKLLKDEWDKVKEESKRGDLKDVEHCLDPILRRLNERCLRTTSRWM
jgi:hypothetical protein